MMDTYESRRRQQSRARERQEARKRRNLPMATWRAEEAAGASSGEESAAPAANPQWRQRALLMLQDAWWYLFHKPQILKFVAVFAGVLIFVFLSTHIFAGRIFPNVWAFDVHLGDMTVDEAEAALSNAWNNDMRIDLISEGQVVASVSPAELGMQIDARAAAENARGVGLSGLPFGYGVSPAIEVDYTTAQNFMLNLWDELNVEPFNAGYEWRGGELVGVAGSEGQQLDIGLTIDRLTGDAASIVADKKLELFMLDVQPDFLDPEPYLADARDLASQPLELVGYDPFTDETIRWTTSSEEFARWLEAGPNSLMLRPDAFDTYLTALNSSLVTPEAVRYLDKQETIASVQEAIVNKSDRVQLRIRYRQSTYEIVSGDSGFKIARKTGIPYYMIEQTNPGLDWNALSIGTSVELPSRDEILPLPPVAHKRIVVDLDQLYLIAYENGQEVFRWRVSSGKPEAPTSPGIYQILSHSEKAVGSGVDLCGANGNCGTWEMNWFMGIYSVSGGVINGFHGAVLLPNGALWSNTGGRDTYGCIMADDANAKLLYDWAEDGTIVEVISSDFLPESALGWQALNAIEAAT